MAVVGHLAQERAVFGPDAKLTVTAAVPQAVGGYLIDRGHQRGGWLLSQSGQLGVPGHEPTHAAEAAGLEGHECRISGPGRHGPDERLGEIDGPERTARLPFVALGEERVRALRLLDHSGGQGLHVVRAQQPERRRRVEGDVQQRLMQLAFGKLHRGTIRAHRLADSPQLRGPGMNIHESPPRRDDPCRVAADGGHIGEAHLPGANSQLAPEHVDLRAAYYDEYRVTGIRYEERR